MPKSEALRHQPTPEADLERRASSRIQPFDEIGIEIDWGGNTRSAALPGRGIDLSPTGIQLSLTFGLPQGQELDLQVTLPQGQRYQLHGTVRWSGQLLDSDGEYRVGVELIPPDDEQARRWTELVPSLAA